MTPFFRDDHLTVYQGDCREVMAAMEPESVHCVVTSPPYWGLRDYGTATWVGGDEGCDHRIGRVMGNDNKGAVRDVLDGDRTRCKCGAVRQDSQLGLEPTPEAFVANMVDVFREVRRVLRKDGTLWLNLGDSYASGAAGYRPGEFVGGSPDNYGKVHAARNRNGTPVPPGLKPKDLVGIPWRVAFALQADGWYLRSDIIWSKPNPMPESVTDRPTKAHEYLFLLTKSARYYYDADAVREDGPTYTRKAGGYIGRDGNNASRFAGKGGFGDDDVTTTGRNLRSVWTIATEPYPGAHFATFPRKLVEPCVKAGTSEKGVCPECGAPWTREVDVETTPTQRVHNGTYDASSGFGKSGWLPGQQTVTTTGWRPSCAHDAEPVAATVLDCFAGSGTTGLVAQALGRRAVLIDLSADYLLQLMSRNQQTPLGIVG